MSQGLVGRRAQKIWAIAFFLALLGVGLAVYRDYGVSWDESDCRKFNGLANYRFVVEGDATELLASNDKYHGPAFELLLVFVEKALHLTDSRDIYFSRHLVTFLLFFAAVLAFYRLLRTRFHSRILGLTGALFLVLSPRIFADAFYNSKDLAFLSCFVFSMVTFQKFLGGMNYSNAAWHALTCGIMIDIRLIGVVMAILTVGMAVAVWLASYWHRPTTTVRPFVVLAYIVLLCCVILLFWPVLWLSPWFHLRGAWLQMSFYPWPGSVFYAGAMIPATKLPWHYIPVWILITTPVAYSLFFLVGAVRLLRDIVQRPIEVLAERPTDVGLLLAFALPPAAIITRHSVVYDGWRHLFFIYPAFLFFAVLGLATLYSHAQSLSGRFRPLPALLVAATAISLGWIACTMVRDHPYQYVYFNRLAGGSLAEIKARFECDYWGVSCREGLEFLVRNDPSPQIKVFACSYAGVINAYLLPPAERDRICFTNRQRADYLLSHFRDKKQELPPDHDVFSIRVDGAPIMVVQKSH